MFSKELIDYVQKLDNKLNKRAGWEQNNLKDFLVTLEKSGKVEVGWRESCGSTDFTMFVYREWLSVVKKLKICGISLKEERIKHKNSYATLKGGFWQSTIYSLN